MARKHARLMLSIWDDREFTALSPTEQGVYFGLCSSRDLSWCGVAPLLPKRLVRNSRGLTERKVAAAILEAKASESDQYLGAFLNVWGMRYLAPTLEQSVARFYQMGLPESVMVDAALYATSARGIEDRGAYFAGICWKRVRAMREIAEQIVAGDDAP